jgi:predicted DNA-binding protein YlxM (UPF0122 family)
LPLTPLDPLAAVAAQVGHLQRLLDVYGPLLTDHQREACRLRLDEDWSYSELAETFGCTRSGAYDLVRRALAQLEHYEERLGHAAELARRDAVEAELRAAALSGGGVPPLAPAAEPPALTPPLARLRAAAGAARGGGAAIGAHGTSSTPAHPTSTGAA